VNASGRTTIVVTCEQCRHRQRLAAPLGSTGHEPGDVVYTVCGGCEGVLQIDIPGERARLARLWQR
jgi:hypothetical protein